MIPVKPQLEPGFFNQKVRIPGNKFLNKLAKLQKESTPAISSKEWARHDDWKHVRSYMMEVYKGLCAYIAHWMPSASNPNIDHFIPKSKEPWLAYEWSNYRLACPLVNTHKGDYQDVLDPFTIEKDWFFLDFPSLMLKPNPDLPEELQEKIRITINRLKLNEDEAFVIDRDAWLMRYCQDGLTFAQLKRDAPFLAYELERQSLVKKIKDIMCYPLLEEEGE